MALNSNISIQRSVGPSALRICYPMAVTWKNSTIILGGYRGDGGDGTNPMSTVYCHLRGTWTSQETSGESPMQNQWAHVINAKIYVMDKNDNGDIVIRSLDPKTWMWTMLTPSGTSPLPTSHNPTSWIHDGTIYYFGGGASIQHLTNQLVCYKISKNSWEWPSMGGDIPSPRANHLMTISGTTVFLFGGMGTDHDRNNDLYILDLPSMRWRVVHGNISRGEAPQIYHSYEYTLTCITQSTAVLFGHRHDLWLLNLTNAKQETNPSLIWTKMALNCPRYCHAAVLQPLSKRLWIIGGIEKGRISSEVLKINFMKLSPLKDLAIDNVARNMCAHDPRLAPDQLSRQLRYEIEAYRCEIGDQYSCPEEDWRKGVCPLEERRKSEGLLLLENIKIDV